MRSLADIINHSYIDELREYISIRPAWYKKEFIHGYIEPSSKDMKRLPISPIHYAAVYSTPEFFHVLVEQYARASAQSEQTVLEMKSEPPLGEAPLHFAVLHGQHALVRMLLERGCDIDTQNSHDQTPLALAVIHSQTEICKLLINNGADLSKKMSNGVMVYQLMDMERRNGTSLIIDMTTEFFAAIKKGDSTTIQKFLKQNPTWLRVTYNRGLFTGTPLQYAIHCGKLGAFIAAYNSLDFAEQNKLQISNFMNNYCDPAFANPGTLAANWVREKNSSNIEELRWLQTNGAILQGPQTRDGDTLLHLCAYAQWDSLLTSILNNEVYEGVLEGDLHRRTSLGRTALDIAAAYGNLDMVQALLGVGAAAKGILSAVKATLESVGLQGHLDLKRAVLKTLFEHNNDGKPLKTKDIDRLLRIAIREKSPTTIILFLLDQQNVDIEYRSKGYTLLMYAVANDPNNVDLASLLIERGADVNATDKLGNTLLHLNDSFASNINMIQCLIEEYGLLLTQKNQHNVSVIPKLLLGSKVLSTDTAVIRHLKALLEYTGGLPGSARSSKSSAPYMSKAWLELELRVQLQRQDQIMLLNTSFVDQAAISGNLVVLREIRKVLGEEAWRNQVNMVLGRKITPLGNSVCASHTSKNATRFLLEHGADPSRVSVFPSGPICTPFAYCCLYKPDLVEVFLEERPGCVPIDVDQRIKNEKEGLLHDTPLLHALLRTHQAELTLQTLEQLIKAGADVSVQYQLPAGRGGRHGQLSAVPFVPTPKGELLLKERYQAFLKIIQTGAVTTLKEFIDEWNPSWLRVVDPKGQTPLHHAVKNKNEEIVAFLLGQEGVNRNAQDANGNTAFHLAVASKNKRIIRLLRDAGVDRTIKNHDGKTAKEMSFWIGTNVLAEEAAAFKRAVETDDCATVKSMLISSPELFKDDPHTILEMAVRAGAFLVFQYLANRLISDRSIPEAKAKRLVKQHINQYSNVSEKRLSYCVVEAGRSDLIPWYHEHGANFQLNKMGGYAPPIWIAANRGDLQCVAALIKIGVDVDRHMAGAETALLAATFSRNNGVIDALLCAGADPAKKSVPAAFRLKQDKLFFPFVFEDKHTNLTGLKASWAHGLLLKLKTLIDDVNMMKASFLGLFSGANTDQFSKGAEEHLKIAHDFLDRLNAVTNEFAASSIDLSVIQPLPETSDRDIKSVEDYIANPILKTLMRIPLETLKDWGRKAKANNKEYKKNIRGPFVRSFVRPWIVRYNTAVLKNNPQSLFNALNAFGTVVGSNGDHSHLEALKERLSQYIESVLGVRIDDIPRTGTVVVKAFNYSVDTTQVLYQDLPLEAIQAIKDATPIVESGLPELVNAFKTARENVFKAQQAEASTDPLAAQIIEFRRLMMAIPEDILEKRGVFSESLHIQTHPLTRKLELLHAITNRSVVADVSPSVPDLAGIKEALTFLKTKLPAILKKLKEAESKHRANERNKAKKEIKTFVVKELKAVNQLLDLVLEQFFQHSASPVNRFLLRCLESANITHSLTETYYPDGLEAAIRTMREHYATLRSCVGLKDEPGIPVFDIKSTAKRVAKEEKFSREEFQGANKALKESLGVLLPLLIKAFAAEKIAKQESQAESKLYVEFKHQEKEINNVLREISSLVKSSPTPPAFPSLDRFRRDTGCQGKNFELLRCSDQVVKEFNLQELESYCASAQDLKTILSDYHNQLDAAGAAKRKALAELKLAINIISKRLDVLQTLQGNTPFEPGVLVPLQAVRTALGCTGNGLAPITSHLDSITAASTEQLNAWQEQVNALEIQIDADTNALQARYDARQQLSDAVDKVNRKLKRLHSLRGTEPRDNLDLKITEPLAAIRAALSVTTDPADALAKITYNAAKREAADTPQLEDWIAQVNALDELIAADMVTLTGENASSNNLTTMSCEARLFNKALEKLRADVGIELEKKVEDRKVSKKLSSILENKFSLVQKKPGKPRITESLSDSIAALIQRVGFEASHLEINPEKIRNISPDKQRAIVEEIKRLKEELTTMTKERVAVRRMKDEERVAAEQARKAEAEAKRQAEEQVKQDKANALDALETTVGALNTFIETANNIIANEPEKLTLQLVERSNRWRDHFKEPTGWWNKEYETKSTKEDGLQRILFDKRHCEQKYNTEQLQEYAAALLKFQDQLQQSLSLITQGTAETETERHEAESQPDASDSGSDSEPQPKGARPTTSPTKSHEAEPRPGTPPVYDEETRAKVQRLQNTITQKFSSLREKLKRMPETDRRRADLQEQYEILQSDGGRFETLESVLGVLNGIEATFALSALLGGPEPAAPEPSADEFKKEEAKRILRDIQPIYAALKKQLEKLDTGKPPYQHLSKQTVITINRMKQNVEDPKVLNQVLTKFRNIQHALRSEVAKQEKAAAEKARRAAEQKKAAEKRKAEQVKKAAEKQARKPQHDESDAEPQPGGAINFQERRDREGVPLAPESNSDDPSGTESESHSANPFPINEEEAGDFALQNLRNSEKGSTSHSDSDHGAFPAEKPGPKKPAGLREEDPVSEFGGTAAWAADAFGSSTSDDDPWREGSISDKNALAAGQQAVPRHRFDASRAGGPAIGLGLFAQSQTQQTPPAQTGGRVAESSSDEAASPRPKGASSKRPQERDEKERRESRKERRNKSSEGKQRKEKTRRKSRGVKESESSESSHSDHRPLPKSRRKKRRHKKRQLGRGTGKYKNASLREIDQDRLDRLLYRPSRLSDRAYEYYSSYSDSSFNNALSGRGLDDVMPRVRRSRRSNAAASKAVNTAEIAQKAAEEAARATAAALARQQQQQAQEAAKAEIANTRETMIQKVTQGNDQLVVLLEWLKRDILQPTYYTFAFHQQRWNRVKGLTPQETYHFESFADYLLERNRILNQTIKHISQQPAGSVANDTTHIQFVKETVETVQGIVTDLNAKGVYQYKEGEPYRARGQNLKENNVGIFTQMNRNSFADNAMRQKQKTPDAWNALKREIFGEQHKNDLPVIGAYRYFHKICAAVLDFVTRKEEALNEQVEAVQEKIADAHQALAEVEHLSVKLEALKKVAPAAVPTTLISAIPPATVAAKETTAAPAKKRKKKRKKKKAKSPAVGASGQTPDPTVALEIARLQTKAQITVAELQMRGAVEIAQWKAYAQITTANAGQPPLPPAVGSSSSCSSSDSEQQTSRVVLPPVVLPISASGSRSPSGASPSSHRSDGSASQAPALSGMPGTLFDPNGPPGVTVAGTPRYLGRAKRRAKAMRTTPQKQEQTQARRATSFER